MMMMMVSNSSAQGGGGEQKQEEQDGSMSRRKGSVHPLEQIAESPSHKLLLKQWAKEEDLILRRIALKESQIDALRRDIASLSCAFLALQSALLLVLLPAASPAACRRSWIPCLTSLLLSLAAAWALRYKTDAEAHNASLLRRERDDALLLAKCIDELKRTGLAFDLLKEVDALRRAKTLRVAAAGPAAVRRWSARDLATMSLLVLACAFVALTRFVLCH